MGGMLAEEGPRVYEINEGPVVAQNHAGGCQLAPCPVGQTELDTAKSQNRTGGGVGQGQPTRGIGLHPIGGSLGFFAGGAVIGIHTKKFLVPGKNVDIFYIIAQNGLIGKSFWGKFAGRRHGNR